MTKLEFERQARTHTRTHTRTGTHARAHTHARTHTRATRTQAAQMEASRRQEGPGLVLNGGLGTSRRRFCQVYVCLHTCTRVRPHLHIWRPVGRRETRARTRIPEVTRRTSYLRTSCDTARTSYLQSTDVQGACAVVPDVAPLSATVPWLDAEYRLSRHIQRWCAGWEASRSRRVHNRLGHDGK